MMKKFIFGGFLLFLAFNSYAQGKVRAEQIGDRIDITIGDVFFTSYRCPENEKYPFFFPLNGPVSRSGMTTMRDGLWSHHSSLFFGCDMVNGGNYWQDGLQRGRIVSLGARIVENGDERVVIEDECIWKRPDAEAPIIDRRKITVASPAKEIFQLDFDIEMEMLTDVTILKTNHSLFSIRTAPDLSPRMGGTMINAEGLSGEKETFGQPSAWIDCWAERKTGAEGIVMMQHPSNKWFPSPWFTRDYGFISPTPMYFPADDRSTVLKKGEKVRLRYRVIAHAGNDKTANVKELFEQFANIP